MKKKIIRMMIVSSLSLFLSSSIVNTVYANTNNNSIIKKVEEKKGIGSKVSEDLEQGNAYNDLVNEKESSTENKASYTVVQNRLVITGRAAGMKFLPITFALSFVFFMIGYISESLTMFKKTGLGILFSSVAGLIIILFAIPIVGNLVDSIKGSIF